MNRIGVDKFSATPRSDLARRTITAVLMLAVALACLVKGGWIFAALTIAVGGIMMAEWIGLARRIGAWWIPAGLPYVLVPVASIVALRWSSQGLELTLWCFVLVWATDIGAYFAGRAIGGPRLAPAISPAKTWSGLAGGMAAAAMAGGTLALQIGLSPQYLWLGAPLAVLAQIGDLFESWLKRRAHVKDSGTLLPGHGGVLDRVDGLVPVASALGLMLWIGAI